MIEFVLNISASKSESLSKEGHFASGDQDNWAQCTRDIANNGDRVAFAKYYETFFDTMFTTVKRATGCDESTCLDIVQDAMVKAISKMKVLDSHDQATAWTKVVAKTTAYDYLRRHARQQKLATGLVDSGKAAELENTETESLARIRWIEEQLLQLPPELNSMISMKYRMGWTLRQIGEKFGLKTGAVDGKIRRAMNDLKTRAIEEFADE
jgi:RNA polymerase sigma-70 factor (ECF subfamily)